MSYFIVDLRPEGVKAIHRFESYEQADDCIDHYGELLPHAFLEIVHASELSPSETYLHD